MKTVTPRELPSVGELLEHPTVRELSATHGEELAKFAVREAIDSLRCRILQGEAVALESLPESVEALLEPSQKRVLNLTGTILHTNLGRARHGTVTVPSLYCHCTITVPSLCHRCAITVIVA